MQTHFLDRHNHCQIVLLLRSYRQGRHWNITVWHWGSKYVDYNVEQHCCIQVHSSSNSSSCIAVNQKNSLHLFALTALVPVRTLIQGVGHLVRMMNLKVVSQIPLWVRTKATLVVAMVMCTVQLYLYGMPITCMCTGHSPEDKGQHIQEKCDLTSSQATRTHSVLISPVQPETTDLKDQSFIVLVNICTWYLLQQYLW